MWRGYLTCRLQRAALGVTPTRGIMQAGFLFFLSLAGVDSGDDNFPGVEETL